MFPMPSTHQPAGHQPANAEPGSESSLQRATGAGSRGADTRADGAQFLSRSHERDEAIYDGRFDEDDARGEQQVESWLHLSLGLETG